MRVFIQIRSKILTLYTPMPYLCITNAKTLFNMRYFLYTLALAACMFTTSCDQQDAAIIDNTECHNT